jgi:hemerythrin
VVSMRKTSDIIWQDTQHQLLFKILEDIREPGSEAAVLHKLQDYIDSHFSLEERYMEVLNYPGREAHVQAHDRFRNEIERLLSDDAPYDDLFRDIIATFLTEWLTRHVFGIDKELEAFLLRSIQR